MACICHVRTGKYLLMVKFITADIIYLYVLLLYYPQHIITHLYASELNAKNEKGSSNQRNKSNRKAMNRNWSNQKANPALKTKVGNK